VAGEDLAQFDESAHDGDVDLDGALESMATPCSVKT
jgi:hypothetical protein